MTVISMIVAAAENNVIGLDNKMPWHIPEDFKYFKAKTMGKPCIMGRKTFQSIYDMLGKALPNRPSIVISRSGFNHAEATSAASIPEAIEKAKTLTDEEVMIIGGAMIYEQALEMADRIYLTRVNQSPEGDAFFPQLDMFNWRETSREDHDGFSFLVFDRV